VAVGFKFRSPHSIGGAASTGGWMPGRRTLRYLSCKQCRYGQLDSLWAINTFSPTAAWSVIRLLPAASRPGDFAVLPCRTVRSGDHGGTLASPCTAAKAVRGTLTLHQAVSYSRLRCFRLPLISTIRPHCDRRDMRPPCPVSANFTPSALTAACLGMAGWASGVSPRARPVHSPSRLDSNMSSISR